MLRTNIAVNRVTSLVGLGVVVVQFGFLITLMICAGVISRQAAYAIDRGTQLQTDGVFVVWSCDPGLRAEIARLPEVLDTTCSTWNALSHGEVAGTVPAGGSQSLQVRADYVDDGFFELYGLKPLAGRLFDRNLREDYGAWKGAGAHSAGDDGVYQLRHIVLSARALQVFGISSPADAIGKTVKIAEGRYNPRGAVHRCGAGLFSGVCS